MNFHVTYDIVEVPPASWEVSRPFKLHVQGAAHYFIDAIEVSRDEFDARRSSCD